MVEKWRQLPTCRQLSNPFHTDSMDRNQLTPSCPLPPPPPPLPQLDTACFRPRLVIHESENVPGPPVTAIPPVTFRWAVPASRPEDLHSRSESSTASSALDISGSPTPASAWSPAQRPELSREKSRRSGGSPASQRTRGSGEKRIPGRFSGCPGRKTLIYSRESGGSVYGDRCGDFAARRADFAGFVTEASLVATTS